MAKNLRVHELAQQLGMSNEAMLTLCDIMGVGVKSANSTLIEAQADRLRRRAERDGLTQPVHADAVPTKSRVLRVHELARELGLTTAEMMKLCDVMGVGVKTANSTIIEAQSDRLRRRAERDKLGRFKEVEPRQPRPDLKHRVGQMQSVSEGAPQTDDFLIEAMALEGQARVRPVTPTKLLYLTRLHEVNGRESIAGRSFIAQLRSEGVHLEARHAVMPDDYFERAPKEMWSDVLSLDQFDNFGPDCIFAEAGLVSGLARFPFERLEEYMRGGGVVIVEGLGRGYAEDATINGQATAAETAFLRTRTVDGHPVPNRASPYLIDEHSHLGSPSVPLCRIDLMTIADWLRPVFVGIDRVAVAAPIALAAGTADWLATGEPTAKTLVLDHFHDFGSPAIWATVRQVGLGYLAVIAGSVVNDTLVDQNPDNARWLSRLITHLTDAAKRERYIRGVRASPEPPAKPAATGRVRRPASGLMVEEESVHLEFKETARIDLRTSARSEVIEHAVLKTIAAFLNTDGGTLLIGVRDQPREAVGIGADLKTLGSRQDLDAFTNWLATRVEACLGGLAATLTTVSFEEVDGQQICRVDVERHDEVVFLNAEKNKSKNEKDVDAVYVRASNTTRALLPSELLAFARRRAANG